MYVQIWTDDNNVTQVELAVIHGDKKVKKKFIQFLNKSPEYNLKVISSFTRYNEDIVLNVDKIVKITFSSIPASIEDLVGMIIRIDEKQLKGIKDLYAKNNKRLLTEQSDNNKKKKENK